MPFYQCQKCKKTWQYPVSKCSDCFLDLERIKNGKVKVIGISEVSIPTLLHPKVPYFVLVLEDEKGNKWVQKSFKEYEIDQEFKLESNQDKNAVSIWRIKYDFLEAIERTIDLIGGIEIDSDSKIVVLPTLISPKHPYFAENTSPQFLNKVIQYLLQKGAKTENIKVVAQSFTDIPIGAAAQKSQLLSVCQNLKISPLDLSESEFVKKEEKDFNFELTKEIFEADLVINLPILKMGQISVSDNILKFLKKENYLQLKYLHDKEKIMENLKKVLPEILNLAEGESIQRPDRLSVFLGIAMASFNALNLDRLFFEITSQKDLPEILEKIKIEEIPVVGRTIKEVQYDAKNLY